MKKDSRSLSPAVWFPLGIAIALVAGILIGKSVFGPKLLPGKLGKIQAILEMIDENYVDDINPDSLLEASIPDIIAGLDPHSVYIPAADLQAVNEDLEGSFSGIGISFNLIGDTINVLEVISGGPSEKAGLLPGDRIIAIDDSIVAGKGWSDVRVKSALRGPEDTRVKLGVKRATSPDLLTYEIIRGEVPVTSIDAAYMLGDDIGYVRVNKFGSTTFNEFFTSLITLAAQGADKYVIDLRSNGGGFMEMAEMMVNEFMERGMPIVSMKGKNAPSTRPVLADGSGSFKNAEVVVLLDEYSASASEIFAGAIQDTDRGLIIGRRSFGKGLVQNQLMLPDSSAVRLTIARYYTPSGRCIQKTYAPGVDYDRDLLDRYERGELFSADSMKIDRSEMFTTLGGRAVYGGGGIVPDIFVASESVAGDSTEMSTDYIKAFNAGMVQKFTFDYVDRNRSSLEEAEDVDELLAMLPDDYTLLQSFGQFSRRNGVVIRPYYLNQSRRLIVRSLKAYIARDIFGVQGFYEVYNRDDATVKAAIEALESGKAAFPIAQ